MVKEVSDARQVLTYLTENDFVAFDIETNSSEEIEAEVIGIGVSCDFDEGYYFPIKVWNTEEKTLVPFWKRSELNVTEYVKEFCQILLGKNLIMHGGVYDIVTMQHRYGIDLTPALFCDTILLKHTVDEEHPFALKSLATKYKKAMGFSEEELANQEQEDLKEAVKKAGGKWTAKQKDMYMAPVDILGKYCCFIPKTALVSLANGSVKYIEDIKIGEEVITHGGRRKKVYDLLIQNYEGSILNIETEVGRKIRGVTPDHPFLVLNQTTLKTEWVKAKHLKNNDLLVRFDCDAEGLLEPNKFDDIMLDMWWLFGLYQADGYIREQENNKYLVISAHENQERQICNLIEKLGYKPKPQKDKRSKAVNIVVCDSTLGELFLDWSGGKFKCHRKQISKKVLDYFLQNSLAGLSFIAGVYDGDGHYRDTGRGHQLTLEITSPSLINTIDLLLSKYQINSTRGEYKASGNRKKRFTLKLFGKEIGNLKPYFRLKNVIQNKEDGVSTSFKRFVRITKIEEESYKGTVHNIEVEEDHSYAVNGIITHNCADVDLTLKLFDHLENDFLIPEKLDKFFYNQEVMPLYRSATIPMKLKGVCIDVEYFKKLKSEVENGIIKLTDEVFELIAEDIQPKVKEILDKAIKTTKTGNFATKVLQYYNIDPPINKKTGKPTLAKSALQSLTEQYPDHPALDFIILDKPLPEDVVYKVKKDIYIERYPDRPNVFNLASTKDLSWLLFEHYKCKPTSRSRKTGAPQVDKKALHTYDLPFIKKLLKLKKEEKVLSTYINPILEKHHNGWIYPSMFQFGTTSGRYSCGGGLNLQTLPKDDVRIKRGFIAPKGYKVVNADFSSLEPRIFSWVSGDKGLKEVYLDDLDLYSKIAIDVLKLEGVSAREEDDNFLKKVDPKMRDIAKVFTLAVPYGANSWRIAQIMSEQTGRKVTVQEAQEIISKYLEAYPELEAYMENQEYTAMKYGKVWTKFGRVRHLPGAKFLYEQFGDTIFDKLHMAIEYGGMKAQILQEKYVEAKRKEKQAFNKYKSSFRKDDKNKYYGLSKKLREKARKYRENILEVGSEGVELYYKFRNLLNNAKNFPIQATAAHVCNAAMIKLSKQLKENNIDGWLALTIHDEITCIVKEDQAELVAKLLKDAMENNWVTEQIDVPMMTTPLIADNFAEAK